MATNMMNNNNNVIATTTCSRQLTPQEITQLRTLFEVQLFGTAITNITSSSADETAAPASQEDIEDAIDLIDYALDMIERKKNVGSIVQEVRTYLV